MLVDKLASGAMVYAEVATLFYLNEAPVIDNTALDNSGFGVSATQESYLLSGLIIHGVAFAGTRRFCIKDHVT